MRAWLGLIMVMFLVAACDGRGPCEGRGMTCTGEALCDGFKSYHFAGVDETGCFDGRAKRFDVNNVPGSQAMARACAEQELGTNVMAYQEEKNDFAFAAFDQHHKCSSARYEINTSEEKARACLRGA